MESLQNLAVAALPRRQRLLWPLSGGNVGEFLSVLEEHADNVTLEGRFDCIKGLKPHLLWHREHVNLHHPVGNTPPPRIEESVNDDGFVRLRWDSLSCLEWWMELQFSVDAPRQAMLRGRGVPHDALLSDFRHDDSDVCWRWDSPSVLPFWAQVTISLS